MSELGGDAGPVVLRNAWHRLPSSYNYVNSHGLRKKLVSSIIAKQYMQIL